MNTLRHFGNRYATLYEPELKVLPNINKRGPLSRYRVTSKLARAISVSKNGSSSIGENSFSSLTFKRKLMKLEVKTGNTFRENINGFWLHTCVRSRKFSSGWKEKLWIKVLFPAFWSPTSRKVKADMNWNLNLSQHTLCICTEFFSKRAFDFNDIFVIDIGLAISRFLDISEN